MRIRRGAHKRLEALATWSSFALLTILLLTAMVGCGTRQAKQAPAGSRSQGESSAQETVITAAEEPATQLSGSRPARSVHWTNLTERGCVRFDPQWTTVRVGESITWHSELKAPLRIYVSPGLFSRKSYLVRPGATVSTGPARAPGRYSFWTEPTACREAPRGVLLAGPGVRVRETFYASAPGVR